LIRQSRQAASVELHPEWFELAKPLGVTEPIGNPCLGVLRRWPSHLTVTLKLQLHRNFHSLRVLDQYPVYRHLANDHATERHKWMTPFRVSCWVASACVCWLTAQYRHRQYDARVPHQHGCMWFQQGPTRHDEEGAARPVHSPGALMLSVYTTLVSSASVLHSWSLNPKS